MGNPVLEMLNAGKSTNNIMNAQSPQQMLIMMMQQYPEMRQLGPNPTPQAMQKLCEQLCRQKGLDLNMVLNQAQQIAKTKKF